ncbi:chromatin modification-related protein MEAF6-like isoform X3 [Gossypium australe]|uniref:Chromatin modification-related protein MEAF6-like isoform X3 n=1 Tax=Gossypium australe TaxID=47621 RepID=A0A5B6UPM0_9ROSI|nr:chromatin modification-related protein MEAF6-like isoform X3 [Gossypium australe]
MDHNGQRGSSTPSAMLATLLSRRAKLQEELGNIERQVISYSPLPPICYLQDPGQCGNVLKGFEGFLSSSNKNTALYGMPALTLFPLSRSGPGSSSLKTGYSHYLRSLLRRCVFFFIKGSYHLALLLHTQAEEVATARDGEPVICRGKPKKGRGREAKKMRHFSEPDYDYDDDPDVTL